MWSQLSRQFQWRSCSGLSHYLSEHPERYHRITFCLFQSSVASSAILPSTTVCLLLCNSLLVNPEFCAEIPIFHVMLLSLDPFSMFRSLSHSCLVQCFGLLLHWLCSHVMLSADPTLPARLASTMVCNTIQVTSVQGSIFFESSSLDLFSCLS